MGDSLHLSLSRLGVFDCLVWVSKCGLRVLQSRVLKVIFGSKGEDLTAVWRKVHSEGLRDLHSVLTVTTSMTSNMGWALFFNFVFPCIVV